MVVMACTLPADVRFGRFWIAHLVVAGSFLWVAGDLIRWGSLVDARRRPHPSLLALFGASLALDLTSPAHYDRSLGATPLLTAGLVVLGGALLVLAIDDRGPDPLIGLLGRVLLISGGAMLAVADVSRMVHGFGDQPGYSLGVGGAGVLLGAMAGFEARLLWRAAALAVHDTGDRQ